MGRKPFSPDGDDAGPSRLERGDGAGREQEILRQIAADAADELEREARERDERAADEFGAIARLHEAYLYRAAVRLSGDKEIAKDLAQETLARALLHFGQFKPGTNVRAWLATILTRLFFDHLKHEKVVTRASPELMALETIDRDMTIPRVSDAVLWAAVESFEPDLRSVVELRYCQQLSYREIADALQLRVGTVGTRLMRAHERLKCLLRPPQVA
jgi:RNA polymerase sigma-70 factor (ECF subfamily)